MAEIPPVEASWAGINAEDESPSNEVKGETSARPSAQSSPWEAAAWTYTQTTTEAIAVVTMKRICEAARTATVLHVQMTAEGTEVIALAVVARLQVSEARQIR